MSLFNSCGPMNRHESWTSFRTAAAKKGAPKERRKVQARDGFPVVLCMSNVFGYFLFPKVIFDLRKLIP